MAIQVYSPESSSVKADNVIEVKVSFVKMCALLTFTPSFFHPMLACGMPRFDMLHCNVTVADPTAFTNLAITAVTVGGTRIIDFII